MSDPNTTVRQIMVSEGRCKDQSWEDWSAELDRLGGDLYGPRGVIAECGTGSDGWSAWRGYYDGGYSPREALAEDASYGE